MASEVGFGEVNYGELYRKKVWFINEGWVVIQGSGREDDVVLMTSEDIERVRAIGGHVVSPFTVIAVKASLLAGATAVILQQVTGEDVVTRSLADLTHFSLSC